jgi:amidase
MAGQNPRDPLSLDIDPAQFAEPLGGISHGLRVGWLGDYDGYLPMEEGVIALCRKALGHFESLGCTVSDAKPDFDMARLWRAWLILRHWSTAAWAAPLYHDPARRAQLKPELIWEIEGGLGLSAAQVSEAMAVRAQWYAAVNALFERFDFLVLPTAQVFPFDAETHWPREVAGRAMDTYHRWMEVVIGGTMSGCPIVAVPAGFSSAGLPMGLQLIGPLRRDLAVLRMGAAYTDASRFGERAPKGL